MATFIHNEPTSLPTIQEAGLPFVFYKAIEDGIEPVIEVNNRSTLEILRLTWTCLQVIQSIPMIQPPRLHRSGFSAAAKVNSTTTT